MKILNILCLHLKQNDCYVPVGVELGIVGNKYKNQTSMFEEMKWIIVASFNPQWIDGKLLVIPWDALPSAIDDVKSHFENLPKNTLPLFEDTLEDCPITDGNGNIKIHPKDFPFYHLQYWLVEVYEKLPWQSTKLQQLLQ
ncbi:hypothetical protein IT409_02485 [Candidatus Falkowbacteria bacterium]|nr:hypothetical protein [Candidatus Falkowbacteria bacterium]